MSVIEGCKDVLPWHMRVIEDYRHVIYRAPVVTDGYRDVMKGGCGALNSSGTRAYMTSRLA